LSVENRKEKTPSLLLSLLPFLVTGVALGLSVFVYDVEPHVAVLLGAITAGSVAYIHGFSWETIEEGFKDSIYRIIPALIILLIIGMIIGIWISSGIVPALIYYGFTFMQPSWFLPAVLVFCSFVSIITGSSWTTIGTIGVASIGVGQGLGIPEAAIAGAVVSGAFFGDKLSPLSDTTNLTPAVLGVDLYEHIKHMLPSTIPIFGVALVLYTGLGLYLVDNNTASIGVGEYQKYILEHFNLSPLLAIPPAAIIMMILFKVPAIPSLTLGVILGGLLQMYVQDQSIGEFFTILYSGFTISTDWQEMDALLTRGGMSSMYSIINLGILSLALGGIMYKCKMLGVIVGNLGRVIQRQGDLIVTTLSTSIFINIFGANQYLAVIIPAQMYEDTYKSRNLHLKNLSRALESGGTLTAPLIPWNSNGIFVMSVLGVNALAYAPYAFICWMSVIVVAILGYANISMTKIYPSDVWNDMHN